MHPPKTKITNIYIVHKVTKYAGIGPGLFKKVLFLNNYFSAIFKLQALHEYLVACCGIPEVVEQKHKTSCKLVSTIF